LHKGRSTAAEEWRESAEDKCEKGKAGDRFRGRRIESKEREEGRPEDVAVREARENLRQKKEARFDKGVAAAEAEKLSEKARSWLHWHQQRKNQTLVVVEDLQPPLRLDVEDDGEEKRLRGLETRVAECEALESVARERKVEIGVPDP
jgi:hypothetical protein